MFSILRKKLIELQELEHGIAKFAADCTAQCAGVRSKDCVIVEDFKWAGESLRRYVASDVRPDWRERAHIEEDFGAILSAPSISVMR
jgi:hypothetical protein